MAQADWPMLANRTQGKRAVGGHLDVVDGSLRFTPNAFDAATGGEPFEVPTSQVATVGTEPGRWALSELFSGGLRTRLAVDLTDGTRERFVVKDPDTTVAKLRARLEAP